jgi:hypothetical protein
MLARHSFPLSTPSTFNSLRIRTYKPPLPQPFCLHHLQTPPVTVHSKAPTSPPESTPTQFPAPKPLILRTYKKHGGRGLPRPTSASHFLSPNIVPSQIRNTSPYFITSLLLRFAFKSFISNTYRILCGRGFPLHLSRSSFDPCQCPLYTDVLCFGPNCRIPSFPEEVLCTSC